ncbi:MAG: DUF3450 domain-containing protein [Proteobacteria bacterium]|nr:DUF3450 domain-containing protein [Pseudomonadota bacterium]MBU1585221.1 DUF3450 domain-containing protein [Pseudomonadota bacterium]MBU2431891.1 DUF3450 domain-containing protein [Pseudomonadota bacterium]MBU2454534.1 DUF3450 domain-containing protein [Pseudomonadota bacterium]MBU2629111.1 DUF3450 domain-containing protein [Pseudomonadota bacterium]
MNDSKKKTTIVWILAGLLSFCGNLFLFSSTGQCQASRTEDVKQPVEQSVKIRQETQRETDQWEQEKAKLIYLYDQLKAEHEALATENKTLSSAESEAETLNLKLLKQKQESVRIQKELLPFLNNLYARLATLVSNDTPFLKEERALRLQNLEKILASPEVTVAEKYRKVMEALFIEADYGNTIEIYQEKVLINNEAVLGDIFRLGRVCLFFLSLDQTSCAYYNVTQKNWTPLEKESLAAIRSGVEIGQKRKPAQLLALPLGRLAVQGDEQ